MTSRLLVAAVLAAAAAGAGCGGASPTGPSGLVVVLLDTTRADHLSAYGHAVRTTPTIDAIAAEGVRFDAAYATSSLTPVSTGSILTGCIPSRHGLRSLFSVAQQGLAAELATWPELLEGRGYRTGAFVSAAPMGAKHGFDRGFEVYSDDFRQGVPAHLAAQRRNLYQRRGDVVASEAVAWLDEVADDPFALLLHMFDPHDAQWVPNRAFLERHTSLPVPADLDARLAWNQLEDPARRIELYDAEVRFMDDQVARVLAKLDALGRREDTVVLVLADHGEGLGQHDFWTHGLLWDEQLRVPLIAAGPGLPSGLVVPDRVRLTDVMPTLCELFDLPLPVGLDGESLMPLVRGEAPAADALPRELYAEVHHAPGDSLGRDPEMYALVVGRWKYVHRPTNDEHQLFDLDADPGELTNLYTPGHPVAVGLAARLERSGVLTGGGASLEGMSAEELQALKDLGYL